MLYIVIILFLVIIDQLTKYFIIHSMNLHQSIPVIQHFFSITSVRNNGAAWSLFEGQMTLFYIISTFMLAFLAYWLIKDGNFATNKLFTFSMLFIIAGLIGNFIDRIYRKEVIDFLDFVIFKYNFPVFNVADTLLTLGTIGFAISILFTKE